MSGLEWLKRLARMMEVLKVEYRLDSEYLKRRAPNAEGDTITSIDHPNPLILFRDAEPTASAVLEEVAHALQHRRGHFAECDIIERSCRREIEVAECLIANAARYALPEAETLRTRRQLADYRERLAHHVGWRT